MPNPENSPLISHRLAVFGMVVVNVLWATAGVISRQIQHARGVEVTFWRSVLTALSMVLILSVWRGVRFWRHVQWKDSALWLSASCWAIMFTAFMMAMSFTTVANVLIMTTLGPLFTALSSRIFLKHCLPGRTWAAIALAAVGMAYMYAFKLSLSHRHELVGIAIAALVPIAASFQWTLMHSKKQQAQVAAPKNQDMLPGIVLGALLSALFCLPFALPVQASASDMGWLALLGMFQLAIPCGLLVVVARVLHAPEISLLGLLESVFGILFAWLWGNEVPDTSVLIGGSLVIGALAMNELLGWRQRMAA